MVLQWTTEGSHRENPFTKTLVSSCDGQRKTVKEFDKRKYPDIPGYEDVKTASYTSYEAEQGRKLWNTVSRIRELEEMLAQFGGNSFSMIHNGERFRIDDEAIDGMRFVAMGLWEELGENVETSERTGELVHTPNPIGRRLANYILECHKPPQVIGERRYSLNPNADQIFEDDDPQH